MLLRVQSDDLDRREGYFGDGINTSKAAGRLSLNDLFGDDVWPPRGEHALSVFMGAGWSASFGLNSGFALFLRLCRSDLGSRSSGQAVPYNERA